MYSQTSWIVMKKLNKNWQTKTKWSGRGYLIEISNVQFPHEKQENKYLKNTRILHL